MPRRPSCCGPLSLCLFAVAGSWLVLDAAAPQTWRSPGLDQAVPAFNGSQQVSFCLTKKLDTG